MTRVCNQDFYTNGGNSRAVISDWNLTSRCEPSQKGLSLLCPQRQRETLVRPLRLNFFPLKSNNSKSPSTLMLPLFFTVIFVAIEATYWIRKSIDNCVFSHKSFITPDLSLVRSKAIVNFSAPCESIFFFSGIRAISSFSL